MQVRFLTFSAYHGKHPVTGSTHIRVNQLLKYWPEADLYLYGEHPDVLIFQKVYCSPDYKFPAHYPEKKILDLCDADWFDGTSSIKETVDAVDAITCSSENLVEFIKQLTDKPVIYMPDRFDMEAVPTPKKHVNKATKIVWFGYRHNAELLRHAMQFIYDQGYDLIVISDDDPMAWQWLPRSIGEQYRKEKYTYIKYDEEHVYDDLQRADFAFLPEGRRPQDRFKSNNRTIKAVLAGLPVAKDPTSLELYKDPKTRQKTIDKLLEDTKRKYDVRRSVEQYKEIINTI